MRHILFAAFVGTVLLSAPTGGAAQSVDTVHIAESRSALLSGVLEWLVPTVGYAYAGDWKGGLLPNTVRIGGTIAYLASDANNCEAVCTAGLLAGVGGTVWAIVGAAKTAKRRPSEPQPTRSGLMVVPSQWGGAEFRYSWIH